MQHQQTLLSVSIDNWMSEVRNFINNRNPELNTIAEIYISEAKFGRKFIDDNLNHLPIDAKILEIGAGTLLLSTQLVREGRDVTALEPVSFGFSHFTQLQALVLELAGIHGITPKLLNIQAENLKETSKFDFAFSINVMEHVDNVDSTIKKVTSALKINAPYRFTCPNYFFPYEPHFNIPTFFNKKFTEKLLKNKIYNHPYIADPKGVWESLNWITVGQIKITVISSANLAVIFNKNILGNTFHRLVFDADFSSRRSKLIVKIVKLIVSFKLHRFMQFIPLTIQPIIDCTITKTK
jgi:hypothetical protein